MANSSPSEVTHKTALITGAGRRIGRALAVEMGAVGWAVAIHYNGSSTDADATASTIRKNGGTAVVLQADLTDTDALSALVANAANALGPLGCLINNASIFEQDDVVTATAESWDAHMGINLRAPFLLSQAFAKQVSREERGAIINIVDERVWNLTPHFVSYTVSKAGLWTLTQTMAMALAPRIRVNAIGPGPTLPSPRQSQAQFESQWESMPLKRGTSPSEICTTAKFILSAPAMTGQMIALDGGQHLGWGQSANARNPSE
jgi:NAD(P)-dependent dehydrogenase (short-subunit alcohol dehydrogenase family)